MKTPQMLVSMVVVGFLFSCSNNQTNEIASKNAETTKEETAKASVTKEYALNEVAVAGSIDHIVSFVEKLDAIPASYATEKFKKSAKDLPASEGFVWYHIKGSTSNKSAKSASVKSISLKLKDAAGNEYKMDTKVAVYVEREKLPTSIQVQPTQTVEWEAYYMLPKNASGIQLMASDLKFVPDNWVVINL